MIDEPWIAVDQDSARIGDAQISVLDPDLIFSQSAADPSAQQLERLDAVVNLKTANGPELTLQPTLLTRVDEVVQ